MNISLIAGFSLISLSSVVCAQPAQNTSAADVMAPADHHTSSPGTTGAMNMMAKGVATSPDDVKSQQEGRRLAADGGGMVEGRHMMAHQSPGTVGASPGND